MNRKNIAVGGFLAASVAASLSSVGGCPDTVMRNLTKERTGNISMQFINNTRYRAAFSFGTWDASDRTPGPAVRGWDYPSSKALSRRTTGPSTPKTMPAAVRNSQSDYP